MTDAPHQQPPQDHQMDHSQDDPLEAFDLVMEDLMIDNNSLDDGSHQDISSPASRALSPPSHLYHPDDWRLSNPVHMEVQENAKLPIFNLPIDRSGSSHVNDDIVYDNNLSERFLSSSNRRGIHAHYEQAGALKHDARTGFTTTSNRSIQPSSGNIFFQATTSMDETKGYSDPLDALAAQVDPTSLSDIQRHHARHDLTAPRMTYNDNTHHHLYGGRNNQLPMPSSSSNGMNDAVATAAAIAGQPDLYSQQQSTAYISSIVLNNDTVAPPQVSGAMARASQQKTQYGFGSTHKVPSIPHAPKKHATAHEPSSASVDHNSGAAYERKKHRAKVARVKLNESIEHLSVAIHLAGTQSKERCAQWEALGFLQDSTSTQFNKKCMLEAAHAAESAKKWDRPSFVESAAQLIQSLNAQCEMYMRELMAIKQEKIIEANAERKNGTLDVDLDITKSAVALKRPLSKGMENGHKRQRVLDGESNNGKGQSLFVQPRIITCIATYLDPMSLVQCTLVSKGWNTIFANHSTWYDRAVERFGYYNVRQWNEKLSDYELGTACAPLRLYESMDAENVMPHFAHDNMFLLGEARVPGSISAWTFLVERSNGETLRSVRREDDPTVFTSQPIVELRTVIQNTGVHDQPIVIREQLQTVDASTRRRAVEMKEIVWDDRFKKRVLNLDGTLRPVAAPSRVEFGEAMCRLELYEAAVITSYIHVKGCSTISKFVQRSNFSKVLVQIRHGTTVPLVIPFPRDSSHHLEH